MGEIMHKLADDIKEFLLTAKCYTIECVCLLCPYCKEYTLLKYFRYNDMRAEIRFRIFRYKKTWEEDRHATRMTNCP